MNANSHINSSLICRCKFSYTHLMLICERSFYVKDALDKTFEKYPFLKFFFSSSAQFFSDFAIFGFLLPLFRKISLLPSFSQALAEDICFTWLRWSKVKIFDRGIQMVGQCFRGKQITENPDSLNEYFRFTDSCPIN